MIVAATAKLSPRKDHSMRMAPLAEDAPIWPGRRLYASRPWIAGSIDESGAGYEEVDSTEGIGEETCNGKEKKRD